MQSFSPPDFAVTYESPEGCVILWFPVPGIAAGRCVGHVTGEIARRTYDQIDAQEIVPYEGFIDLYDATGFDWEARGRALKWNIVHLSPKMRLHMLVHTAPMLLASNVFKRTLGEHVEVHTDQQSFSSAYSLAVKRKSRVRVSEAPRR